MLFLLIFCLTGISLFSSENEFHSFSIKPISDVGDQEISPFLDQEHQNLFFLGGWNAQYEFSNSPAKRMIEARVYSPRLQLQSFDNAYVRETYAFSIGTVFDSLYTIPLFGGIDFQLSSEYQHIDDYDFQFGVLNTEIYFYSALAFGVTNIWTFPNVEQLSYHYIAFVLPFNDDYDVSHFFRVWRLQYRFEALRTRKEDGMRLMGYRQELSSHYRFSDYFQIYGMAQFIISFGDNPLSFAQYEVNRYQYQFGIQYAL